MSHVQWAAALATDAADKVAARCRAQNAVRGNWGIRSTQHVAEDLERRMLLSVAPVFFHPQQTFPGGTDPQSLVVADMNGDGKPDMVVANFGDNTVGVMLGNGDGTFGAQTTFATGAAPNGLEVIDVNRDGIPDVIVANRNDNNVSVRLGTGRGALGAQQTFAVGSKPRSIAVGDFNKDGIADLAVANFADNTVSLLLGVGDGTFQAQQATGVLGEPLTIAAGDFNGDGALDVVTTSFNANGFAVLPGNGNGTFGVGAVTNLPAPSAGVAVADFNGDGRSDVAVTSYTGNTIGILLGNGNLNFSAQPTVDTGTGSNPVVVRVADVNGDGKPDVIVNSSIPAVQVFLSNGDGSLAAQTRFAATGASPGAFAVSDVNGDGSPDLEAPNFGDANVSVVLNDPPPALISINRAIPASGSTQSTSISFTVTFTEPVSLGADDFAATTTGTVQVGPLVITPTSGLSSVYTISTNIISGNGNVSLELENISFLTPIVNDVGETLKPFLGLQPNGVVGPYTKEFAVADINGDGKPDVIVAEKKYNAVAVNLGHGDGLLNEHVAFTAGVGSMPASVAVADVNGDGKLDVVAADSGIDNVSVFLGNGNGALQSPTFFSTGAGSNPQSVKIADMNGDGKLDVIVADYGTNELGMLYGNGNGTFNPQITANAGSNPNHVEVADLNQDGKLDIVVTNGGGQTVSVFLSHPIMGIPLGLPYLKTTEPLTAAPASVQIVDVTRDGKPDLVVGSASTSRITVLPGKGDGTFASPVLTDSRYDISSLHLVDLNGDGIPDLVGASNSQIGTMLGNGDGTFQDEIINNDGLPSVVEIGVGDMNSDGKPDLIAFKDSDIAGFVNYSIGVLLNSPTNNFQGESIAILKRDATLTVSGASALFDGNPHSAAVTATGTSGEDLSSLAALSYTNNSDGTTSSVAPTQPGTYEVFATFAGNESYNAIDSFDTGKAVVISPLSPLQSIPSAKLPTIELIAGQKIKPIRLTVKLTNNGVNPESENVTVKVALSASPSGSSDDPVVGTITRLAKLKAHQTSSFGSVTISSIPAGLNGKLNVLLKLSDATGAANLATAGTISVGPASNDLAAISVSAPPKASAGKKVSTTVAVMQDGNIPVNGSLPTELFLSTTAAIGTGAIDLGTASGRISIQPGKKGTLHLSTTVPSTVAAGSYFLIAKLDPANTLADVNAANNIASSVKMISVG